MLIYNIKYCMYFEKCLQKYICCIGTTDVVFEKKLKSQGFFCEYLQKSHMQTIWSTFWYKFSVMISLALIKATVLDDAKELF